MLLVVCITSITCNTQRQDRFALLKIRSQRYIAKVARTGFLVFRVDPTLRRDIQRIADEEQRTITQVCEMFLREGIEDYRKEGPKYIQRLIAKQKTRAKDP